MIVYLMIVELSVLILLCVMPAQLGRHNRN
jgi:hypothetical protein